MLVSLKLVEKFISLPKIDCEIIVNQKKILQKKYFIEKISAILTRQGFEVDAVKDLAQPFNQVVVGQIKTAKPHPNANKLQICEVDVGESNLRQIVCGAKNARENLYVAVALPGAKLPNGIEIKASSIRDVESFGMLCSREELGLPINKNLDGDGIWELNQPIQGGKTDSKLDKLIGTPVHQALDIDDVLLEISVTPNRPDMLCHEGVARELAVGFAYENIEFEVKNPSFSINSPADDCKIKTNAKENSSITIQNTIVEAENFLDAPTFFIGLEEICVGPSPAWLRNTLECLEQTSINNVVDASNYILLTYGQPNHAFDFDKLEKNERGHKKITLRHAKPNEPFLGLDGKPRNLHEADCVVSDSTNVLALLGVLGGESSKVSESTKSIVVEFANPNPVSIRKTSRRHGRQTDASFLFEKGINLASRYRASWEFIGLVAKLHENKIKYSGSFHSKNLESKPMLQTEFQTRTIPYSNEDQKRILGCDLMTFETQKQILKSLEFSITNVDENLIHVQVPQWRINDVINSADLVEECIRVVGIDHIPAQPIIAANEVKKDDPQFAYLEKSCAHCASLGYNEAISLHFMRADDHEKCSLPHVNSLGHPIHLLNPILGDEPYLHTTLIPDLLRKVNKNLNYGMKNGQLFHSCRTFQNQNSKGEIVFGENNSSTTQNASSMCEYSYEYGFNYSQSSDSHSRPVETPRLAGVVFGVKTEKIWQNTAEIPWTLHDILAHVLDLAKRQGVTLKMKKMDNTSHPMANTLHPGRRVQFYVELNDQKILPIAWCGELHPKSLRKYEIETTCLAFEMNMANLMRASNEFNQFKKTNTLNSKFPSVTRDFAFVFDEKVLAEEIKLTVEKSLVDVIQSEIPVALKSVHIFDIYRGKGVEEGKKSMAFKVLLEPLTRTLTDHDIQCLCDKIVEGIKINFNSQFRG